MLRRCRRIPRLLFRRLFRSPGVRPRKVVRDTFHRSGHFRRRASTIWRFVYAEQLARRHQSRHIGFRRIEGIRSRRWGRPQLVARIGRKHPFRSRTVTPSFSPAAHGDSSRAIAPGNGPSGIARKMHGSPRRHGGSGESECRSLSVVSRPLSVVGQPEFRSSYSFSNSST